MLEPGSSALVGVESSLGGTGGNAGSENSLLCAPGDVAGLYAAAL